MCVSSVVCDEAYSSFLHLTDFQQAELPRSGGCWDPQLIWNCVTFSMIALWVKQAREKEKGKQREGERDLRWIIQKALLNWTGIQSQMYERMHTGKFTHAAQSPTHSSSGLPVFYWVSQISSGNLWGPARHWESVCRGRNGAERRSLCFSYIWTKW